MSSTYTELEQRRDHLGRARMFTLLVKARAATTNHSEAEAYFHQTVPAHYKAAIPAALYSDDNRQALGQPFLALSERTRILPRLLGAVKLPPFLRSPIGGVIGQAAFVAQAAPIPAHRFDLELVYADPSKLAMLLVITKELAQSPDDRAVTLIERLMTRVITRGENSILLSADARVAGGTPGGLLNNVTAIDFSPAITADSFADFYSSVSDGQAEWPYIILSARGVLHLLSLADSDAGSIFRNLNAVSGGNIAGIPVLIAPEAGNKMILIDAAMIGVLDDGLTVDSSQQGSLVQDSAPAGGPQQQVSAFQTNSVILRLVRYIDWIKASDDAVAFIELPIDGSPA